MDKDQAHTARGWLEAAVAWEVCASIHATYARRRDPFYSTRQNDFQQHALDARTRAVQYGVQNLEHAVALLDQDGENQAVRAFLRCYGGIPGLTIKAMRDNLKASGFPYWPAWVDDPSTEHLHLNKASAQAWLRHLFNLEHQSHEQPPQQPTEPHA